jgi:hypothetical protein
MSRSLAAHFHPRRRTVITAAAACALATGGALALTGTAQATGSTNPAACNLATLQGYYLFAGNGWSVTGNVNTPTTFAGAETFNGAGTVAGSSTFASGATIYPRGPFTGTYTLAANCTGTLTIGTTLHFDIYVAPSGASFTYIQTDPGAVSATTENQATRH